MQVFLRSVFNMAFRSGFVLSLWFGLGMVLPQVWADGDSSVALVQDDISVQVLEAKINEAESDKSMEEGTRESLIEFYRRSIGNLETRAGYLAKTTAYRESIEAAPAQIEQLRQEIETISQQAYRPAPGFDADTPTDEVAQALLKERANLSAVETDYNRLRIKLEAELQRPSAAREELTEANVQQTEITEPFPSKLSGESATLRRARDWYRETRTQSLSEKVKMLDQELLSHGPRVELLELRVARRKITLGHVSAMVGAIETLLGQRRQADATLALEMAQATQAATEGKHPILVGAAEKNAALSEQLLHLSERIDEVGKQTTTAEAQARELQEGHRGIRHKLEVAGMNKALGTILQEQKEKLPSVRVLRAEVATRERLISDLTLEQLLISDELKQLDDFELAIEAEIDGNRLVDGEPESAVVEELRSILQQRRTLYEKTAVLTSTYLQALSEFEYTQARLLDEVEQYTDFLSERLLWVRSVHNPGFAELLTFPSENHQYLHMEPWLVIGQLLLTIDAYFYLMALLILLALVLLWKRRSLLQQLGDTNRFLGNPLKDSFRHTVEALLLTLFLSMPGPLFVAAVGAKLVLSVDASTLAHALGLAMLWLANCWLYISVCMVTCRSDGLGQRHFQWNATILTPLRREFRLLRNSFLPASAIAALLAALDSTGMEWGVMRLALIITMALFALFFIRSLRSDGGVMRAVRAVEPNSFILRWRRALLILSVVTAMALIILTAIGYVYTAVNLLASMVGTFWVLIEAVFMHQLAVRWLRKAAVALEYKAKQEERNKQIAALVEAGENPQDHADITVSSEVDVAKLGRSSLSAVNIVVGSLALLGVLFMWSNVTPALGYLDNIPLWNYHGFQEGEAVIKSVSLAGFGLAMLLIVITAFVYRNLPSLLELLLLQMSSMTASDRYTATTIVRYVVLIAGVLLVSSMLGLSWSQFQWLAAALGVGIGFGLQEIVANFISGLIILFERPIRVGDRVTVGDVDGLVTRIRIRATTILTWDRQELLVPNKEFITGRLLNWTLTDQVSRLVLEVGVAYGSDVTQAMSLIAGVAQEHPKVMRDPAPFVTFEGFGDNTLQLKLRCFLDDVNIRLSTSSELHESINRVFNEAGIVIAFPQRDIHFDNEQPLQIRLHGSNPAAPEAP